MTQKLTIPSEFPDFNLIVGKAKRHWAQYSALKRKYTTLVKLLAKSEGLRPVQRYPVVIEMDWYCRNRRRDPDNVCCAKKFILDGLVEAGVLKGDSFRCVREFRDSFYVDKGSPRVAVSIWEFCGLLKKK